MAEDLEVKIDSSFYTNIVNISSAEITNSPCIIHIKEYQIEIPLIIALSCFTNLTQQFMSDPTISEFTIDVDFKFEIDNEFIDKLVSILYNKAVTLNKEEIVNFACLGKYVNNNFFLAQYERYCKEVESSLTAENCIDLLIQKHELGFGLEKCTKEISLLSADFENQKDKIALLAKDLQYFAIIDSILKSGDLKLTNEDSLLNFVLTLCTINDEYESLFDSVCLEYCSVEMVGSFIDYINDNIATTPRIRSIISCMSRRLKEPQIPMSPNYLINRHIKKTYEVTDKDPLNGILRRLHAQGKVDMQASSTFQGNVYDLLTANDEADFYTKNIENSWIEASLKENKSFLIKKYMLRGRNSDYAHLKSWKLEGRKKSDGEWIVIDQHNDEPLSALEIKVFPVSCNELLTSVKLTQMGKNTRGEYYLNLNAFDIFGEYSA